MVLRQAVTCTAVIHSGGSLPPVMRVPSPEYNSRAAVGENENISFVTKTLTRISY